jgi:nicotinamidase-related amidase
MDAAKKRTGLDALLTPEGSVLLLIDHQPFQFANLHSHEPTMILNNVVGLTKAAKAFNVPTVLTTVTEDRGGYLVKGVQEVFPRQKPISRTTLNAWEDRRVVDAVKATGRRQLVVAALWSEICLAFPVIHSLADGYDVFFVTDASGGVSREAHDMAVQRMIHGGRRADHMDCRHERVAARLGEGSDGSGRSRNHDRSQRRLRRRVPVGTAVAPAGPQIEPAHH